MNSKDELIASQLASAANIKKIWGDLVFNIKDHRFSGGAKGDGITDDILAIQKAIDSMPQKGGILVIPGGNYYLGSNTDTGQKEIMIWMDPTTRFTGPGSLTSLNSNGGHRIDSNYILVRLDDPTVDKGHQALAVEVAPTAEFGGNGVAGYFGAKSVAGSGIIWALNTMTFMENGFSGNAVGIEVDLDNYAGDLKGQGVLITGLGTFRPEVGVLIKRGDANSDWHAGIEVRNSGTGINIDLSDSGIPDRIGINIQGLPSQHVKIKPSDDNNPSEAVIFGVNSADDQVLWKITKRGGFVIGPTGTEITSHFSLTTGVLDFGTIVANSTIEVDIYTGLAKAGDVCTVTPIGSPAAGIMWSAYVPVDGTIKLRLSNVTTSSIDPDGTGLDWRIDLCRH